MDSSLNNLKKTLAGCCLIPALALAANAAASATPPPRIGMIRDMTADWAVMQSGYWRLEVDLARPRIASLRTDPAGLARYSPEMLEPGEGGETEAQTEKGVVRSRDSTGHRAEKAPDGGLLLRDITLGDIGKVNWHLSLAGDKGEILRIRVDREIVGLARLVTETPFALKCLREFAFWSRPSLRFRHNPAGPFRTSYSTAAERAQRRVIGYHAATEMPEFFVHGSPVFPDVRMGLDSGWHHLEMRYGRHVTFGVSSRDFSGGPRELPPGRESWTVDFIAVPQGESAPIVLQSANASFDRFVREFFDAYLLSGIACDHEYFGNNPYRHAYCPGAIDFAARGYLTSSRRSWSDTQGDIEARWRNHIRRTLREGMVSPERPVILMDSGVWQDACGAATHEYGAPALNANFVLACCLACLKSGDRDFAGEIFPALEGILKPLARMDPDNDGLLESPLPGTPGSPASSYNDNLSIGHKDGYLNAAACEAFHLFASLAKWLDKPDRAAQASAVAAGIRKAFNDQLWLDGPGRYAGWIDVTGKTHDAWYTTINFMAASADIIPPDRLARMMQSFTSHPNHHRIFGAGGNLDPIPEGSYHSRGSAFGLWLNGGVLLGPAAYELVARARGLGAEGAWEMLHDLEIEWQKSRLARIPMIDWCRGNLELARRNPRLTYTGGNAWTWIDGAGASGAGTETYLSDGGAILWALYTAVLGIQADFQGITLEPHIPSALAEVRTELRLLGRHLRFQFRGNGDKLESLALNGKPARANRLPWSELNDGAEIVARMTAEESRSGTR
ncbi:MAG: hypothetical protein LUO80_06600 [Methylococcaceae bacterium]|nr:hypothetical protein [Methylococcaceae bacterium]